MHAIHKECGEGTSLGLLIRRRPQDPHTINGLQPGEQMPGELSFPGLNRLQTHCLEVANRGTHAHRLANGRGARFELVGQHRPGAVVQENVLNHLPAAQKGRHRLQQRLPRPEETHAGGATELVGGADEKVGVYGRHINRLVGQALAGIHEHTGANGMGCGDHLIQGIAATEGIADVHQAHQSGALIELGPEILQIQLTGFGDAHMAQHAAGALRQQLPGHQVAVVLHHREENFVPLLEVGVTPGARHQIDGFAGIAGEDNLAGTGRTHEGRRRAAGRLKGIGGTGTELVRTAMHVGVVAAVVLLQRFEHLTGLLAGGSVIEIDQRAAIRSQLLENREISTIARR